MSWSVQTDFSANPGPTAQVSVENSHAESMSFGIPYMHDLTKRDAGHRQSYATRISDSCPHLANASHASASGLAAGSRGAMADGALACTEAESEGCLAKPYSEGQLLTADV